MHPAENCMNPFSSRDSRDVFQGVHNARVRASQEHDNPVGALDKKRLIISEWVRLRADAIQVERPTRIFEFRDSRNLSGYPQPGKYLARLHGPDHVVAATLDSHLIRARHPNFPVGRRLLARIFRMKRGRMDVHLGLPGTLKHCVKSSGVVVVTVADSHRLKLAQMDSKVARVFGQHLALSGVKEKAPAIRVDPEREPMLAQEPCATHGIFCNNDNFELVSCHGLNELVRFPSTRVGYG